MAAQLKVVQHGDEVALVSSNGGKVFLWLLLLEIALFAGYFVKLGAVVGPSMEFAIPLLPCVGVLIWTSTLIRRDLRISMNLAERQGRLIMIGPIAGARQIASFSLDDVECFALRQVTRPDIRRDGPSRYIIDLQLRCGARHVLSQGGPWLAYRRTLQQITRSTGIGNRVERQPLA